jgi:hypothetical protein
MEKRKFRRVAFEATASVRCGQTIINGTVDNLSMKGMFVLTKETVQCDTPLEIDIVLSGASSTLSITAKGVALRQTDTGFAIKFLELDIDSFVHLKNVVEMNSDDADACSEEYYRSITSQ